MKQEQLIDSKNRQIEIQIQTEKLTSTINTILENTKKEQIDTGNLLEILLARNIMIIIDLQNLVLSITLAKINVIDSVILDNYDLNLITNNEHFTNFSVNELMEVSRLRFYKIMKFCILSLSILSLK